MTMTGRFLDPVPTRRTVGMRTRDLFEAPRSLLRVLRNRREIGSLKEFSDDQLADIGLTRADLRASMSEGRLTDPSGYLTDLARRDPGGARRGARP